MEVIQSSNAVLATLDWIKRQGFRPVPLRKQSKASIDEHYVSLNYSPPSSDLWKSRDLGVGIVTGPQHKGPLDVDIDCPEAAFFAQQFLPETSAVFGRAGKPRSHYLYRTDDKEVSKRALADPISKSTIIELRADGGHQTVMPGSIHEDTGEPIEWQNPNPEPSKVDMETLEFAVKKVGIAVLVVRHLWAPGQHNEICKHVTGTLFYMGWKLEEVLDLIEAVCDFSENPEKRKHLATVRSTFKKGESGGKVTGSNVLRGFLGDGKVVDRIVEWAGDDQAAFLSDYNERFAVVTIQGKFRVAETLPLERGGTPMVFGKEDFLNTMATDVTKTTDDRGRIVRVPKARLWLAHPRRRTYRGLKFLPGQEDSSPYLNLWTGWVVNEKRAETASCRAWLDLLYYVICGQDDTLNNWMLNWFAHILIDPLHKALTAPVIIGKQGAGKSLLVGYMGKILGPCYVVAAHEEHIIGRFNRHLATCLLLHSEEALYGGNRKHANIMKQMVSGDEMIHEKKGIDAELTGNYIRLLVTSNEIWAAPLDSDDRRYTVINMGGRKAEEALIKDVIMELENDGPSALFQYLVTDFKYDPLIARLNVKNVAMRDLKIINFDAISSWWYETLKMGVVLPDYLSWATKPAGEEWPKMVSSSALHLSMMKYNKDRGKSYIPEVTQWALQLNKMVGLELERKQMYYSNPMSDGVPFEVRTLPQKQYTIQNMPALEECRRAFEMYMGQSMDWPKEAEVSEKPLHLGY